MAKYNMIPNLSYHPAPFLSSSDFQKIEKIIWYKAVGDSLNAGDVLCEIHYNNCIFEMECTGDAFLLYQNTNTEVSFCAILSVFGKKEEDFQSVFQKHTEDLKNYDSSNDFLFRKIFQIENTFSDPLEILID